MEALHIDDPLSALPASCPRVGGFCPCNICPSRLIGDSPQGLPQLLLLAPKLFGVPSLFDVLPLRLLPKQLPILPAHGTAALLLPAGLESIWMSPLPAEPMHPVATNTYRREPLDSTHKLQTDHYRSFAFYA